MEQKVMEIHIDNAQRDINKEISKGWSVKQIVSTYDQPMRTSPSFKFVFLIVVFEREKDNG